MFSTTNLRAKIHSFVYEAVPQNKPDSALCTVGEMKHMVSSLAELLDDILSELEEPE